MVKQGTKHRRQVPKILSIQFFKKRRHKQPNPTFLYIFIYDFHYELQGVRSIDKTGRKT